MREEPVSFVSGGERVAGLLRLPESGVGSAPFPTVIQGPGWLQLKEAKRNRPYHEALTAAGFAVLTFDFRGFGESGGDPRELLPDRQVEDLVNATSWVTTRPDLDGRAIGTFGSGGIGAGNPVLHAALDDRVRCVVSQVPVGDGEAWLRSMRDDDAWRAFLGRIDEARRVRVTGGEEALVEPRGDIMVVGAERLARTDRDVSAERLVPRVTMRTAEAILAYRPIDAAHRVRGLFVIGVEGDTVTPDDQAIALYEAARPPKKLVMQRGTTHYAAYTENAGDVIPAIVAWFERHLRGVAGGPGEERLTIGPTGNHATRGSDGQA